ncbi:MAG: hypothetical protein HC782_01070 [Gammaproteobacteria bacterium]|nr:hypothetical protein [Gammaproteobacteria bacterium]
MVELEGVSPVWQDPTPWVAHVSFSSADIDRLADFYANVVNQKASKSPRFGPSRKMDLVSGMEKTEFRAAWIQASNMQIEVIQYYVPATLAAQHTRALGDIGYSYICFEVDDMPAAIRHLRTLGATQSDALAKMSELNRYFCSDPDGNIVLLLKLDASEKHFSIAALQDPTITARMAEQRTALLEKKRASNA